MNLSMGGQFFVDVNIPVLWGTRAVIQDRGGKLSIIDLSGLEARLEVLADKPAPGVAFAYDLAGFRIQSGARDLYRFDPQAKTITPIGIRLPDLQFLEGGTRVGGNLFANNTVVGYGVGLMVSEAGIGFGGPLPPSLAKLAV